MKSEGSLYPLHNGLPLVPIMSHMNPVHALPPIWCKIHYIIILPSMPGSSKWSLPTRFRYNILHVCHMSSLPHSSWFVHSNHTRWVVQLIQLVIMQFPPVPPPHYLLLLRLTMNVYTIIIPIRTTLTTIKEHYLQLPVSPILLDLARISVVTSQSAPSSECETKFLAHIQ